MNTRPIRTGIPAALASVARASAAPAPKPGVHIVAFDITRGGKRQGELFDCIVEILP